jgi:hypothetical protein
MYKYSEIHETFNEMLVSKITSQDSQKPAAESSTHKYTKSFALANINCC